MDNLHIFAFDKSRFTDIQDQLSACFKIINIGEISYYLGIEVNVEVEKKISL